MIKLALCDDHLLHREQIKKLVSQFESTHSFPIQIKEFSSGEELLEFTTYHPNYFDLFLLDIIMDGSNGIETAKELRSTYKTQPIIFITVSKDYAFDSYSVQASGYLLKPFLYGELEHLLLTLIKQMKSISDNRFYVKNNQDIYTLSLDEVVYFESNLRKITAYFQDGTTTSFYQKMSTLEQELPVSYFVRTHRSFLVNLMYIKQIIDFDITTTTTSNFTLPISKKYLASTKDSFLTFIQSKLEGY